MSGLKPTNTNTQPVEREIDIGNAEQAQDLAALQQMAGDGAQPVGEMEPVPAAPDLAGEIAGLLEMAVGMFGPMFPSVAKIYTPQVIAGVSGSISAVCTKRGWMADGLLGEYGEEIACLVVVGPIAIATYKGVKADIEASKPAQPLAELGGANLAAPVVADQTPGAKTVTVGVAA